MNDDALFAHGFFVVPFHASISKKKHPSLVLYNPHLFWIGRHPHPRGNPAPSNVLGLRKIITWDIGIP